MTQNTCKIQSDSVKGEDYVSKVKLEGEQKRFIYLFQSDKEVKKVRFKMCNVMLLPLKIKKSCIKNTFIDTQATV